MATTGEVAGPDGSVAVASDGAGGGTAGDTDGWMDPSGPPAETEDGWTGTSDPPAGTDGWNVFPEPPVET